MITEKVTVEAEGVEEEWVVAEDEAGVDMMMIGMVEVVTAAGVREGVEGVAA
jgi:hypothetical protein